jgi:hypothetical protein
MQGPKAELEGDTKMFVELVAQLVVSRTQARGRRSSPEANRTGGRSVSSSRARGDSPSTSAGSWGVEKAELLVDVPVWSPGCFQGMFISFLGRIGLCAKMHAEMQIYPHCTASATARSPKYTPSSHTSSRPTLSRHRTTCWPVPHSPRLHRPSRTALPPWPVLPPCRTRPTALAFPHPPAPSTLQPVKRTNSPAGAASALPLLSCRPSRVDSSSVPKYVGRRWTLRMLRPGAGSADRGMGGP